MPDNLNLISGAHKAEGENQFPHLDWRLSPHFFSPNLPHSWHHPGSLSSPVVVFNNLFCNSNAKAQPAAGGPVLSALFHCRYPALADSPLVFFWPVVMNTNNFWLAIMNQNCFEMQNNNKKWTVHHRVTIWQVPPKWSQDSWQALAVLSLVACPAWLSYSCAGLYTMRKI